MEIAKSLTINIRCKELEVIKNEQLRKKRSNSVVVYGLYEDAGVERGKVTKQSSPSEVEQNDS